MKCLILAFFGLLALNSFVESGNIGGVDKVVKLEHTSDGFWKKKIVWKPRWVKSWQPKTIYVAHWKKVWGPVKLTEWVPIPKPPPGWVKPAHKHVDIHHHHKVTVPVPVTVPLKTYAPAHVDYVHHPAPVFHPHKHVSLVTPEALHFHAAHDAHSHYGPAFDHHHHDHEHHHHHEELVHHPEPHHHHHEHDHHEHIVNPNAETFHPQFLPLSLDHLKIK